MSSENAPTERTDRHVELFGCRGATGISDAIRAAARVPAAREAFAAITVHISADDQLHADPCCVEAENVTQVTFELGDLAEIPDDWWCAVCAVADTTTSSVRSLIATGALIAAFEQMTKPEDISGVLSSRAARLTSASTLTHIVATYAGPAATMAARRRAARLFVRTWATAHLRPTGQRATVAVFVDDDADAPAAWVLAAHAARTVIDDPTADAFGLAVAASASAEIVRERARRYRSGDWVFLTIDAQLAQVLATNSRRANQGVFRSVADRALTPREATIVAGLFVTGSAMCEASELGALIAA